MQFLVKGFYDSDNRQSIEMSSYLLLIEDHCLIMKVGSKLYKNKGFIELFRKPFIGWHNIRFNFSKAEYEVNSCKYISIQADILSQTELEMARLNYCIERLEPQVKEVIKDIFIGGLQWKDICSKISISEKTLNKYRKKGIEDIISMFDLKRLVK